MSLTYFFAGGGTGGHLFPGLAVARLLHEQDRARIVFVGTDRLLETDVLRNSPFEHRSLPVEPLPTLRRNPPRFLWRNAGAYRAAVRWLAEEKPAAVIGLGGYASAPLVLAAARRRVPVLLLEQNALPGKTTRWLARAASTICISMAESARHLPRSARTVLTGNPVRPEIAALAARTSTEADSPPTLLVLGGSQGAASLNDAVVKILEDHTALLQGWRIVHQTGAQQVDAIRRRYQALGLSTVVEPFFPDLRPWYEAATLIISRAGATTLAELACAGVPAVLVPYPFAADNHQSRNAEVFEEAGAAILVRHASTTAETAERLRVALAGIVASAEQRTEMTRAMRGLARPDACERVVAEVRQLVAGSSSPSAPPPHAPG